MERFPLLMVSVHEPPTLCPHSLPLCEVLDPQERHLRLYEVPQTHKHRGGTHALQREGSLLHHDDQGGFSRSRLRRDALSSFNAPFCRRDLSISFDFFWLNASS